MHCPFKKSRMQKLYTEHGSCAGVARALRISPSTAHVWLREVGVQMRRKGGSVRAPGEPKRKYQRQHVGPPIDFEREPCTQGREWEGEVISCLKGSDCAQCTRGHEMAFKIIVMGSYDLHDGTGPGRRKIMHRGV